MIIVLTTKLFLLSTWYSNDNESDESDDIDENVLYDWSILLLSLTWTLLTSMMQKRQ